MVTYQRMTYVVSRGLYAQRFRRVDLSGIATTGAIALPSLAGSAVDAALVELRGDANWVELARQLAQLRLKGFAGVYLRRDQHDIELVPLYGFSGVLPLSTYQSYFDFVWSITSSLKKSLGSFNLSDNTIKVLSYAASQLDGAPPPTKDSSPVAPGDAVAPIPAGEDAGPIGVQQNIGDSDAQAAAAPPPAVSPAQRLRNAAASILRLICELSFSRTPATGVAAIAISGPTADLLSAAKSSNSSLYRSDHWTVDVVNTQQYAVVIDGRNFVVDSNVARVGSLNIKQLKQALPFLSTYG